MAEYCVIDEVTRVIDIPDSLKMLGITSDENSQVLTFRMPNIFEDYANLDFRVNYQNANGERNTYVIPHVEENDGVLSFSWMLSRDVTKFAGTVQYCVCVIKTDDTGLITYEWNSLVAQGEVYEGLEVTDVPDEETSYDVVGQVIKTIKSEGALEKLFEDFLIEAGSDLTTNINALSRNVNVLSSSVSGISETFTEYQKTVNTRLMIEDELFKSESGLLGLVGQKETIENLSDYKYLDLYISFYGKTEIRRIEVSKDVTHMIRSINIPNDSSGVSIEIGELGVVLGEKEISINSATKWSWTGSITKSPSMTISTSDDLCGGYIYKIVGIKPYEKEAL